MKSVVEFNISIAMITAAVLLGAAPGLIAQSISKVQAPAGTDQPPPRAIHKVGAKSDILYRFQLTGADAFRDLEVANQTVVPRFVRVISNQPGGSGLPEMVRKIAPGESVTLTAAEMGWSAGNPVLVKLSPGLTAGLKSAGSTRLLPQYASVTTYDVFSHDRLAGMNDASRTVTALAEVEVTKAKPSPSRSAAAEQNSMWVAYNENPITKPVIK